MSAMLKTASSLALKRDIPLSSFIPYAYLDDATTFVTKNGDMGRVLKIKGLPFEVTDLKKLTAHQARWAHFLQGLPLNMAVYVTGHRHPENVYPEGSFHSGFAYDFNAAYQKKWTNQPLYTNDFYVTLMVKGDIESRHKAMRWWKRPSQSAQDNIRYQHQEAQRERLDQWVEEARVLLKAYSPTLLGEVKRAGGVASKLLGFLGLFVNGNAEPLAYPLMDLSLYLPQQRVSTKHQLMEWSNGLNASGYGALLSIRDYGHDTDSNYLKEFLSSDFSWVSTHSFCREAEDAVIDKMKKCRARWRQVDEEGNSLSDNLTAAIDGVRSQYATFGWHHHTMMISAETKEKLKKALAQATDFYRRAELSVVRESLNLEAGFFAQMPGNFSHQARRALISHENFADFTPLYNYHHGYRDENHLGSALMLMESQGRTPLYVNFHARNAAANDSNPSTGHTLIVAPTGVGKTTLLCAMDAMSKKYKGRSIFFDRDNACELYVMAMDGLYIDIHPNKPTGFNPLQLPDTPENRAFLVHWLASLLSPHEALPQDALTEITDWVHRNYELPQEKRSLSTLSGFVPIDFPYRKQLAPWLRGQRAGEPDGVLAYLFDNPVDTLDFTQHDTIGFDLTHLLKKENLAFVASVQAYLFHRLRGEMNGQLMGIYCDEGWQSLDNPHFAEMLKEGLATWRKFNVYIVFITQLLESILNASIATSLMKNTATRIFLSNPDADYETHVNQAHLSEAEFTFITNPNTQYGEFLFKQKRESAIGRLNLSGLSDFLRIFSGNRQSIQVGRECRARFGEKAADWLPHFFEHYREEEKSWE